LADRVNLRILATSLEHSVRKCPDRLSACGALIVVGEMFVPFRD
jgi:hypothetical protein